MTNGKMQAITIRILDVNANRATEGLRVVEEHLRFDLEDANLCGECKSIRHEVSRTVAQLVSAEARAACRSTTTDIGTSVRVADEYRRDGTRAIVLANVKRVAESLRVLEEYAKQYSTEAAQQFEALRYRTYTLEKSLGHLARSQAALADAQLYVLIDGSFGFGQEFQSRMRLLLDSDVDVVQLRAKQTNDRMLTQVARQLSDLFTHAGKLFVVNDRPDIARIAGASGLHVGQDEISVADARTIVGPDTLIGVSTHSLQQAEQAISDGADYVGLGPVFPSSTKQFAHHVGVQLVQQVSQSIGLPFFAIGGIAEQNLDNVIAAGATRIAVSHAVWQAKDPAAAASRLKAKLKRAVA